MGALRRAVQAPLTHSNKQQSLSISQPSKKPLFLKVPFSFLHVALKKKISTRQLKTGLEENRSTHISSAVHNHQFPCFYAIFWIQHGNRGQGDWWGEGRESSAKAANKAHPRYCWYITGNCLCNLIILEQIQYWWASHLFRIQDEQISLGTYYSASTAEQDTQL